METKIQLKHPAGKKAVSMDKGKYDVLKKAILNCLTKNGALTHTEMLNAITENFEKNKTKFEGSIGWHMEWIKLDIEARKMIRRVPNTSPQEYVIVP
jgi:hypothetical protein